MARAAASRFASTNSMEHKWALALAGEGTAELQLDIFDDVGDSFFAKGITAKDVVAKLEANAGAQNIKARINSRGGDVAEGMSIYNVLAAHSAHVEVTIVGVAASIASVIAMAADEIVMAGGTLMMIHNSWTGLMGDAVKMREAANFLEKNDEAIADIYAQRTGLGAEEIRAMMAKTTWMKPDEAKKKGFADRVVKPKKGQKMAAVRAMASATEDEIAGLPEDVRALVIAARAEDQSSGSAEGQQRQDDDPPEPPAPNPAALASLLENPTMTISKATAKALNIAEDADEATALAAVARLKASAQVGGEIEKLLGIVGPEAIGAVRALKETQTQNQQLVEDVNKVKAALARQQFEASIAQGLKDQKLSKAEAKHYTDRFESALASGDDGSDLVAELSGWLKVAARRIGSPVQQPRPDGSSDGPMQHNGQAFETMKPLARHVLKKDNPELYETMRSDAMARGAL